MKEYRVAFLTITHAYDKKSKHTVVGKLDPP